MIVVPVTRVEIYRSTRTRAGVRSGVYRWRAKAANGEIVATGEPYVRRWNAHRGALRAFPHAEIVDV